MDKIKLNINLPHLKLDMEGDPAKNLNELKRVLQELNKFSLNEIDSELGDGVLPSTLPFWKLSKEIQNNEKIMSVLDQVAQVEEAMAVKTSYAENINEITEHGYKTKLNMKELKRALSNLFSGVDLSKINFVLLHVKGKLNESDYSIVQDHARKYLTDTKMQLIKTKENPMGKTFLEAVMFGNIPQSD